MSVAERKAVLEAWVKAGASTDVSVIAHVGSEAITDVLDLAKHAQAAGAVAMGVTPTSFFKPDGLDAIMRYLELVADAAPCVRRGPSRPSAGLHTPHHRTPSPLPSAAPTPPCSALPLYYYHIAIKTAVFIRCDKLLQKVSEAQAAGRLRTFRGIKYSDADLHILSNCLHHDKGAFDILYGKDEQLIGALSMGCRGAVGSTYNYMGRVYNKLIALHDAGDRAGALAEMRKSQEVVNILYCAADYGSAGAYVGKAIMELRLGGKHCGPPRVPMVAVTPAGMVKLRADLEALGFFGW
jgi:N-acetylneuraminate lyase